MKLNDVGTGDGILAECDESTKIDRCSLDTGYIGEAYAMDGCAFNMLDRQHRAEREVALIEAIIGSSGMSGMKVILASSGSGKNARLDVSFAKARLVAHEAQRTTTENWIEYGQRQT